MGITIKIDEEFKSLIPPLSKEEFAQLEENCIKEGIRDPLVVWHVPAGYNILIDGHNRYQISQEHNLPFEVVSKSFNLREDAEEWIIKNQLGRRNIPAYVRAELALKLKPLIAEKAKENQGTRTDISQKSVKSHDTQKELATIAGVSHDTIHKVETIQAKASQEAKEALRRGDTSINQVYSGIKAAENDTRRKQEDKELREAKKRHDEYSQKPQEDIIDFESKLQDTEDKALIYDKFEREIMKVGSQLNYFASLMEDEDFKEIIRGAKFYQLSDLANKLSNWHRVIIKMQRQIEEVKFEK